MDFPSRSQLQNGASQLPVVHKEIFGYDKLTDEERKPLDQDVLLEDVKNADILMTADPAEDTAQSAGRLQKEVKIEDECDVNGADVSTLNAADLLEDSDDEKKAEVREMENNIDEIRNQMVRKRKHEQTSDSHLLFDCPAENCLLSFGSFEELKEHVKMSHSDKEGSVCNVCKKVFCSIDEAMEHFRKREKIGCCACGKWFAYRTSLMKHLRIHVGLEQYPCAFCGRRFTQKILLEKHEISHKGQKSLSCGYCGLKLLDMKCLKDHERLHEEDRRSMEQFYEDMRKFKQSREKPHQFIRKGDLESHRTCEEKIDEEPRLHHSSSAAAMLNAADLLGDSVEIKEEPIENNDEDIAVEDEEHSDEEQKGAAEKMCEDRGKSRRTQHSQKKKRCPPGSSVDSLLFTCPIKNCTSSYSAFKKLEEHVEQHPDKQHFFCDVCKKEFSSKEDAMTHIQERQKKRCCGCGRTFPRIANLVRHHRCHTGEKPFVCKTCGKRFAHSSNVNTHLSTHREEKPFSCELCEKRFNYKQSLEVHLQRHTGDKVRSSLETMDYRST